MKLIAEQVKVLRERKNELLRKQLEYRNSCQRRDHVATDYNNVSPAYDYQEEFQMSRVMGEINTIDKTLSTSHFVTDRNLDKVDIGTKFTVVFDDNEKENMILTETNRFGGTDSIFVSLDSDLGKAVYGKKTGDVVVYEVRSTGKKLAVTIGEIDKMKEHYEHFICEVPYSNRGSSAQRKKHTRLERSGDINLITSSQREMIEEELSKLKRMPSSVSAISKKSRLNKILRETKVARPNGEDAQVGSRVRVFIKDQDNCMEREFELIDRAYSTELESHYVEKTSALGNAIYGKKAGDSFKVSRMGKEPYTGLVISVENSKEIERVR